MNIIYALGLGFFSPWWLLLVPLSTAALVYVYRRRGTGQRVLVGTLFLLRSLKRPSFSRKQFHPPPRFYFELFLLLALSLGAAGLYRQGMGNRVAIVIDNSLSMSRSNPRGSTATTALDLALAESRSVVQSLAAESTVEVFITSPHLISLTKGQVNKDAALAALGTVSFAYAEDHLDSAAVRLLSDPQYDKVSVFSDHPLVRTGSGRKLDPHTINVSELGGSHENVGIAQIGYRSGAKGTLVLQLASFLTSQVRVHVVLDALLSDGTENRFNKLAERVVSLEGQSQTEVEFDGISPQLRTFRARIEPDPSSLNMQYDSLRADDKAWLSIEEHGGTIALISQFSSEDLGLSKIPFARFERISPEAYDAAPGQVSGGKYLAAIFHRYLPSNLPAVSSVFIAPVSSNNFLKRSGEIKNVEITRWRETHPILSYVQMPSLKLTQASILQTPDWAGDLISSSAGSIAFAGEIERKKFIALGFELLPFEGKKSPLTSILTLNILKYISELSAEVGYQQVGSKLLIPADTSEVRYLDGPSIALPNRADSSVVIDQPGIVAVSTKLAGTTVQAFNFFDNEESNTLESVAYSLESKEVSDELQNTNTNLAGIIAVVASLLLLADMLLSGLTARGKLRGGEA